jgi:hypothetical protein
MVRYFKTTGIYDDSNLLRVEVKYDKGKGYVAKIVPCHKDEYSYGVCYNKEYFDYYNTLECMLVPCKRKSAKTEAAACELAELQMDWLLEQYVTMAENKGGRHIEIVGELED